METKKEKAKRRCLSLYDSDMVALEFIKNTHNLASKEKAIRHLINFYHDNGLTSVPVETPMVKPVEHIKVDYIVEEPDELSDIIENEVKEEVETLGLDGILDEWIKEPFVLPLNGFPKELIYSEAKIIRDMMGKQLLKEITLEITKVKELRRYKEINDRIESGNAQEGDFNPEVHSTYNVLRDNIMNVRSTMIFPLTAFVHHFNCIVNHHKDDYVEGFTISIDDRPEEDPFMRFREDIEEKMLESVIDFDPEDMFAGMLNKEEYDEHMMRLGKIAKNKEQK